MIDALYRFAYRGAYRLMRVYWAVAHPQTHGALVALWHDGQILLVKNSYVPYYSLPGGYVRAKETGREAAVRELFEETGIVANPALLESALDEHHEWEGKREHIEIFELRLASRSNWAVDRREVVGADYYFPEAALQLNLFPPLRRVIERNLKDDSSSKQPN